MRPVRQALISVSDKTGIVELARALHALGIHLLSTGGTAKLLADAGLPVTEVSAHTGFPEMLDGRVKTLHPAIHGGLLARRDLPDHMAALEAHAISTIDLLVVNLYPFEATVSRPDCTLEDAIENIDIGGPAMVRSAAKNWRDVGVLTDSSQYPQVLSELRGSGALSDATRFALSVAAFNRISNYDAAISDYLSRIQPDGAHALAVRQTAASSKSRTCATGRIRTSRRRSTAISIPRRGRLSPHVSSRARNSPITTSPMPTQRGSASSLLTAPPA
jgi:phosphoribosylaminoimidazolecarboxamide formyltransferase/IMP cyclohydrolase